MGSQYPARKLVSLPKASLKPGDSSIVSVDARWLREAMSIAPEDSVRDIVTRAVAMWVMAKGRQKARKKRAK